MVQKGLKQREILYSKRSGGELRGDTLCFRIPEAEAKSKFIGEYPSSSLSRQNDDFIIARKAQNLIIKLTQVTKKPYVKEEVVIKKKPLTETKTLSDQVTSEEVRIKGSSTEEEA